MRVLLFKQQKRRSFEQRQNKHRPFLEGIAQLMIMAPNFQSRRSDMIIDNY